MVGAFIMLIFRRGGRPMASRIQGITVEIGGDTTKLQTALKGLNDEIKSTQAQLKDVEKLLKMDPGNTELLAQKEKLLAQFVHDAKSDAQREVLFKEMRIGKKKVLIGSTDKCGTGVNVQTDRAKT